MDIKLNIFEITALLEFLKDHVNHTNLSVYPNGAIPRQLLLAFVKLQKAKDEWQQAMRYTE